MQTAPPSSTDTAANVDLPDPSTDPNTTNLDLTIHAHLNSSVISTNKQTLDKETVEKQKHEVRFVSGSGVTRSFVFQGSIKISLLCGTRHPRSLEIVQQR